MIQIGVVGNDDEVRLWWHFLHQHPSKEADTEISGIFAPMRHFLNREPIGHHCFGK